ncbi:MAG: YceI family protein, partial [Cytophagales bacterium]|nr:YceI family protein [Cytophagales bacterium]
ATFKGKINEDVDLTKPGTYNVTASGKLSVHGVEKDKTITGVLKVESDKIFLDSSFEVVLEEYNITRPSVVMMKIAEKVLVKAKFTYLPKK